MKKNKIKAQKREEKRKKKEQMRVSGKSVFHLKEVIAKKSKRNK